MHAPTYINPNACTTRPVSNTTMIRTRTALFRTANVVFFFSSRREHTRCSGDWSSDVCSSDLGVGPLRGLGSQNWVQAEVLLAPGNSGGPLADARGKIVGINTMVAGRLALAIPSNAVRDFLSAIPSDGRLGVTVHPAFIPSPVSRAKTFGLVVLEVEPKSPAGPASLLPRGILLGSEEQRVSSPEDLARAP